MKINTLGYSFKQGFKNIQRNILFSMASIGTIISCLFLFSIFYAIVLNMENEVQSIEDSLTVTVFFDQGMEQNQIDQIGEEIKKINNVRSMQFISAEKAWDQYVQDVYDNDVEYVEQVFGEDNPLDDSSSYEITLKNINKQEETVKQLQSIEGIRKVNSSNNTAKSLSSLNKLLGYASIGVILILLFVSLFLISNTITIGISVRKEEISIMKLIGATDVFVKSPFLVEGVMIGFFGSIIPLIIFYFLYEGLTNYLTDNFMIVANMIEFLPVGKVFASLAPISILIGTSVGFLGSLVTTHKHLKI